MSMISGFVFYRMGYFDSSKTVSALQVSPNGGELLNVNSDPDSTLLKTEAVGETPIMSSTKSTAPIFDLEKYEQKKKQNILPSSKSAIQLIDGEELIKQVKLENPYLYSSKSMTHPIRFEFDNKVSTEQNRQAIKVQPELLPAKEKEEKELSKARKARTKSVNSENLPEEEQIDEADPSIDKQQHKGIAWSTIGLGLLGIVFVSIGSIVYFKRRSR